MPLDYSKWDALVPSGQRAKADSSDDAESDIEASPPEPVPDGPEDTHFGEMITIIQGWQFSHSKANTHSCTCFIIQIQDVNGNESCSLRTVTENAMNCQFTAPPFTSSRIIVRSTCIQRVSSKGVHEPHFQAGWRSPAVRTWYMVQKKAGKIYTGRVRTDDKPACPP